MIINMSSVKLSSENDCKDEPPGYRQQFIDSIRKKSEDRNNQDLQIVYTNLRGIQSFLNFSKTRLQSLSKVIRLETYDSNDIVFCRGEFNACWYILIAGSVFCDGTMYLPPSSFGKRRSANVRRHGECLILEPSELLVIDYEDAKLMRPGQRRSCTTTNLERILSLEQQEVNFCRPTSSNKICVFASDFRPMMQTMKSHDSNDQLEIHQMHGVLHRGCEIYNTKSNRSSRSSDTSSAYSGSDTMQSVNSSSIDDQDQMVDLSGLVESLVDSDEDEDLADSIESLTVKDTVRECLEKDPIERTDDDIEILLEFMQHLPAFANMTLAVKRALCAVMVFAVVDKAGTIVMGDGEELDSWSVIVNGHVEIEQPDGDIQELHLGDSFGITPTMEKLYHKGLMRTKCEDCQFVCITQQDYYRILHQGEENTVRHEENGHVVLITEHRVLDGGNRKGHIVIKGTSERLMAQLVEENSVIDPSYVEDFLLTHRTFVSNPNKVAAKLLEWFDDPLFRDRVTRVVLLWVNNHFTDFEMDPHMMEFLETFESCLDREKMVGPLRLLNIACAAKARSRNVTLARSTRDEVLHFSILGGYERGFGVFISKVDRGSRAEDVGLKRGDQILEVNGQSFEHIGHARALEVLRGSTHLSITVKSNLLAFKEMLTTPENVSRSRHKKTSIDIARLQPDPKARLSSRLDIDNNLVGVPTITNRKSASSIHTECSANGKLSNDKREPEKKGFMTLGHKTKLRKALKKLKRNVESESQLQLNNSDDSLYNSASSQSSSSSISHRSRYSPASPRQPTQRHSTGNLYHSYSNPDLSDLASTATYYDCDQKSDFPEHVLKIYRADQTCKYLLVHKETTAREVVMLTLREFSITDPSSNYSLCEVTVGEGGMVKQRRLPDQLQNLAERIGLNSRYYLKNNTSTEPLVPDDLAGELLRENLIHFLQLNSIEVATQLTLEDFNVFRQVEPTEYIDDLFELNSKYGTPLLSQFAALVNREMFWAVSEVCREHNLMRRMKVIKQFIKIARQCKECKNFNSMFAIISGLGHGAVSRLRTSWEKLPTKYQKMFDDLQDLMDPSRNMSKYRNLLNSEHLQPPLIPFYPVVSKDLTFIHLGNDTVSEGLVNFEKLRMIAKEIRQLSNMCSAPYDLYSMLDQPTTAMMVLNSMPGATTAAGSAATMKRRKKSSAIPNPKRMFEEAQMVRRVKAYLTNLKVTSDESQLHKMSTECEPMPGTGVQIATGSGPPPVRKRHPSPTLSTASSTSSTSEGKKSIGSGPKFGADSPQAVRKLLALSELSKVRPHHPPQMARHNHPLSPSPSPNPPRRGRGHDSRHMFPPSGHGRSHSDTLMSPSVLPVDLCVESSSVTSLSNHPLRKSQTSGSVTSTETYHQTTNRNNAYDTDSVSGFDSRSISSAGSTNSPPVHQRYIPASLRQTQPLLPVRVPSYPHAVAVLPTINMSNHLSGNHRNGPPISIPQVYPALSNMDGQYMKPRARRPPEYNVAAQMAARHRQSKVKLGRSRAHSHDGILSGVGFYGDGTDPDEDDDNEAQVSAV